MKQTNSRLRIDWALVGILFLLAVISNVAIAGSIPILPRHIADHPFVELQIMWFVIGSVAIIAVMLIDFGWYQKISWYLYGLGMALLLAIELRIGDIPNINGAYRWFRTPVGNFQPSELVKVIMVVVISTLVVQHNEKYPEKTKKDDLWLLGKIALTSVPPLLLILRQPDLGNTLVIAFIVGMITLMSGIRLRYIVTIVGVVAGAIGLMVLIYFVSPEFFSENILRPHQLDRFYGWLAPHDNPRQGFQLLRGLLAAGTGGLTGRGFQNSDVLFPEAHTDYIFIVIAKQWGFIGATIVIFLFFLLIYRILQIAVNSNESFGSYLCSGVAALITFQVFQNVGMVLGLMPITGITLPFLSYGGSSLATMMLAIGFVLNVHSRTRSYMFKAGGGYEVDNSSRHRKSSATEE